jgi:spore germination protein YaaH
MDTNATARTALTAMQALVPGSLLTAWTASGGNPWTSVFSKAEMAATIQAVDQFWIMEYAMCGHPPNDRSGGMSNDPMPFIEQYLNVTLGLGIPASKIVVAFPWYNCDFDCGEAGNPAGGVNCSALKPKEFCPGANSSIPPYKFCWNNFTDLGYAQTLPMIGLGQRQGNTIQWDDHQIVNWINYYNESDKHYHQVWFDNPKSLELKYQWAAERGLRGVGMWTPSATLFDEDASRAMWAAVPTSAEAGAARSSFRSGGE